MGRLNGTKEVEAFICGMGRDMNREEGCNITAPWLNEMQEIALCRGQT